MQIPARKMIQMSWRLSLCGLLLVYPALAQSRHPFDVAAFAHLTGNQARLADCRTRFKPVLLPEQMAADGSFPLEMKRTRPYGYSLFNLEAMAAICQILSTPEDNLWAFALADGRGMRRGMEFMAPYIRNKKSWPRQPDVMFNQEWPMRQSSLLFAGLGCNRPEYIDLWKTLLSDSTVEEVVRNFFIHQPVLWVESPKPVPHSAGRSARWHHSASLGDRS
jgi:hypothetical protein